MLNFYTVQGGKLRQVQREELESAKLAWVDLLEPTLEEERFVETLLGADMPTREEMHEIELSSRLYQKDGALFATATLVTKADTLQPETHAVTFVLAQSCLVTIRYSDPQPFRTFIARMESEAAEHYQGSTAFAGILDLIVDRLADILELIGHRIDSMTRKIFMPKQHENKSERDFESLLHEIGVNGDLLSKTRESLLSINRLLVFISQTAHFTSTTEEAGRVSLMLRDMTALGDHAGFLANKLNFLLDATLGMINIQQNSIIKIFSVAAVVFLPPTLVASVYGMNFHFMPELDWPLGYPFAITLMILSAWLPYTFFKRKGWL